MTVFFNFFEKSATKHQLAYRYGARKGNLTFFENRSLNRGLLSLYEVEEEKSFEKMSEIQDEWTVLCGRRKLNFFAKYRTNDCLVDSVMRKSKNYLHFVFKSIVCIEYWCKKEGIIFYFLILYSNKHEQLSVDVKRRNIFIFNLTIRSFHSLYGVEKMIFFFRVL